MPEPRVAHSMFCDDVRPEVGNKMSLMGLYGSELIINSSKPATLATLVVVAFLVTDISDPPTQLKLRVIAPNKTEIVNTELPPGIMPTPKPDSEKLTAMSIVKISPFHVDEEGYLEVYFDTETGTIRAGRLMVRFASQEGTNAPFPTEPSPQSSGVVQPKKTRTAPSRPSPRRASPKRNR